MCHSTSGNGNTEKGTHTFSGAKNKIQEARGKTQDSRYKGQGAGCEFMKVLVVGGAGYIGSHMLKTLAQCGHEAVTRDNLSTGWKDAVRYGEFVEGDAGDRGFLKNLFAVRKLNAVMHFCVVDRGAGIREVAREVLPE